MNHMPLLRPADGPAGLERSPYHTALRCAFLMALHHGYRLRPEQMMTNTTDPLVSARSVLNIAGFRTRVLRGKSWQDLLSLGQAYPVMAIRKSGHWISLIGTSGDAAAPAVLALDPAAETAEHVGVVLIPREEFLQIWGGTLILCKRAPRLRDENQPFGLRWFAPEILRHASVFRDVALAALASNVIGLCTPLLFQVIIDKVVSHRSYQTLLTVILIFLVLTVFDGIFGYVRQRMMLFATNKIDARLAARTYQRLLSLPMPFFEKITAGVLARHMQQTERLRHFLTGRLFQTLLDAATLPVLIALLIAYSGRLTLVVLGFTLVIAGVIAVLVPLFRANLNQLYNAEGERQAHLVETIHGMRTIKSLALEPLQLRGWESKVVAAIRRHASVGKISAVAGALTSSLDKFMQISVIGIGVVDVFDGKLSIGTLVAFTMLSQRVSGPLVQIVGLINEYQETALSVRMLATVMDHPPEQGESHPSVRPVISGQVTFDQVTFRYAAATTAALDRVSFEVRTGQIIGVVGRSGSGKTTVTRLLQGIQTAQEGAIRLGGIDLRHIDLAHLRQHVGVVLQDSFLFRGSIRDNIAASRPDVPLEYVIEAARMAGATEFIDRLPLSYDTILEEGAANLSGGQRQRLAIARALLPQPRLLVFDEATSALDPESEAIIQTNLQDIARNRTMIIVSHRLSSLVTADAILVLEHGKVVDFAPHSVLLGRCATYKNLWDQQTRHVHA